MKRVALAPVGKRRKARQGSRYAWLTLRLEVYQRDEGECQYCARLVSYQEANIDHVRPYWLGGKTVAGNLVVACRECNQRKGNQLIPDGYGPLEEEA